MPTRAQINTMYAFGFSMAVIIVLILSIQMILCRSEQSGAMDKEHVMNYLTYFGYLPLPLFAPGKPDTRNFTEAVVNLQLFAGLPPTGELDDATIKLINTPRCGNSDALEFRISFNTWSKTELTYFISTFYLRIPEETQRKTIREAWNLWATASALSFREVNTVTDADIVINFFSGNHNDGSPFDGEGGVLGHAFQPESGWIHFDGEERWSVGPPPRFDYVDLFVVAAHEFGHALGLVHSSVWNSLMYPFYKGYVEGFQLHSDDKMGIQFMYGENQVTKPLPTSQLATTTTLPSTKSPTVNTLSKTATTIMTISSDATSGTHAPNTATTMPSNTTSRNHASKTATAMTSDATSGTHVRTILTGRSTVTQTARTTQSDNTRRSTPSPAIHPKTTPTLSSHSDSIRTTTTTETNSSMTQVIKTGHSDSIRTTFVPSSPISAKTVQFNTTRTLLSTRSGQPDTTRVILTPSPATSTEKTLTSRRPTTPETDSKATSTSSTTTTTTTQGHHDRAIVTTHSAIPGRTTQPYTTRKILTLSPAISVKTTLNINSEGRPTTTKVYTKRTTPTTQGDMKTTSMLTSTSQPTHGIATTTRSTKPRKWPLPLTSNSGVVDAVVSERHGTFTYIFAGSCVLYKGIDSDWSASIPGEALVPGLPVNPDAALYFAYTVYIFKGCQVWRLDRNNEYITNRWNIPQLWMHLPCDIQAAYRSNKDGYIYFFKDNLVYKYIGYQYIEGPVTMNSLGWINIPHQLETISAVYKTTGRFYFITGHQYYTFNDNRKAFVRIDGQWLRNVVPDLLPTLDESSSI